MNRRRFLTITAASLALPASAETPPQVWQGRALGAAASIRLASATPTEGRRLFHKVEKTLAQIESHFSLHRDSALTRLNRDGYLPHPAPEILQLFGTAGTIHTATQGAFDPSIQPLWLAIATGGDTTSASALVGWHRVTATPDEIRLAPGTQLTFNGIAQGHAADRVAALLRAEGFTDVLIDMGEIAALGTRADGSPWQAGIALPDQPPLKTIPLKNRALATSSPNGTLIGKGRAHILHPALKPKWQIASVSAASATTADALSTAFCLLPRPAIEAALAAFPDARLEVLA